MDPVFLNTLEKKYGVEPGLLNAIMQQESGGKADAVSPKGAKGWFQFMPGTAQQYGVKDPTDFYQSAEGAAKYLSTLHKRYGNWDDALRAYNWGEGNLDNYKKGVRTDIPKETVNYVPSVRKRMGKNMADLMPADLDAVDDSLHADLGEFDTGVPAAAAAPARQGWPETAEDRTKRLSKDFGDRPGSTLIPMAAGVVGGLGGGAAGSAMFPGAGTVAGGVVGGTLAPFFARLATLPDTDQQGNPVSAIDKLEYAFSEGKWDLGFGVGGAAATRLLPAAARAIAGWAASKNIPQDDITRFLVSKGLPIPATLGGEGAARATSAYANAAKKIVNGVEQAWDEAAETVGRTSAAPQQAGEIYQEGYKKARKAVQDESDRLLSPFQIGGRHSTLAVTPTKEAQQIAAEQLAKGDRLKIWDADVMSAKQVKPLLEKLSSGKPLTLGEAVELKQFFSGTANYEKLGQGVDNAIRKKMAEQLDIAVEGRLGAADPALKAQWQNANKTISNNLELFNDASIMKLAQYNPDELAKFVGKSSDTGTMRKLREVLARPEFTDAQRDAVLSNVRRTFLESRGGPGKLAEIYRGSYGKGDKESYEAFRLLFRDSPQFKMLMDIGGAQNRTQQFAKGLARGEGGAGELTGQAAVASLLSGGNQAAVAGSLAKRFTTDHFFRFLAHAATDPKNAQQVSLLTNWSKQLDRSNLSKWQKAKDGFWDVAPPAVARAMKDLSAKYEEGF